MKKTAISVAALCLAASMGLNSCIGSFALTHQVLNWNNQIGSKFLNELVFFAFWIVPVYEVTGLADLLVINSIEFWSGSNPVMASHQEIDTEHGRFAIDGDQHGYTVTNTTTGEQMRLQYDDDTWAVVLDDGQALPLLTFIDDTHVALPGPDGQMVPVRADQQGVMAYSDMLLHAQQLTAQR